ncbi:MAG: hypothetical protein V3U13_10100, partial [Gemmatimonadota bacterium]
MNMSRQPNPTLRITLTVALVGALAACNGSDAPRAHEWQAVYDTIGDTVVVRTVAGSIWGDTAELVA